MSMKNFIINWLIRLALFAGTWFLVSIAGILSVISFMFAVRNESSYDLEMGWMVFIMMVPVVSIFVSVPVVMWIHGKIRNRFNLK